MNTGPGDPGAFFYGGKEMRTPDEIRNMIDKYIQRLDRAKNQEEEENCCRTLDALLWVLEDSSGAPI